MHPNPAFRSASRDANLDFARDRAFGALSINAAAGPLIAHVPFVISGDTIELHLVRSNPIARTDLPAKAVIAVNGPDGYISPDWYGVDDQVPTWNYIAVHLRGVLEPLPDSALRGVIDRLSEAMEARLAPKPVWRSTKMDADSLARMMRMIRPFRLCIEDVQGTWKLSQNKPAPVRHSAADAVGDGFGSGLPALARAMRDDPA